MPETDLDSLVLLLYSVHNIPCTWDENLSGGQYVCTCPDDVEGDVANLPSLKITLSKTNTYELPLSELIMKDKDTVCYLAVMDLGA